MQYSSRVEKGDCFCNLYDPAKTQRERNTTCVVLKMVSYRIIACVLQDHALLGRTIVSKYPLMVSKSLVDASFSLNVAELIKLSPFYYGIKPRNQATVPSTYKVADVQTA